MDFKGDRLLSSASKSSSRSKKNQKICKTRFCVNCRNHSLKESITGHKKNCLYKNCQCGKCVLNQHVKTISLQERKFHKLIENEVKKARDMEKLVEEIDADQLSYIENHQHSEETFDSDFTKPSEYNSDVPSDLEDLKIDFFGTIADFNLVGSIETDQYDTFESFIEQDSEITQDYDWTKYLND